MNESSVDDDMTWPNSKLYLFVLGHDTCRDEGRVTRRGDSVVCVRKAVCLGAGGGVGCGSWPEEAADSVEQRHETCPTDSRAGACLNGGGGTARDVGGFVVAAAKSLTMTQSTSWR